MSVDPSSSNFQPPPVRRERLVVEEIFSDRAGERMLKGFAPRDMDDTWAVRFSGGWVNFYRSWTGAHIYALKLDGCPNGVRVLDGWVSRDGEQYRSPGIDHDRRFVVELIVSLFGE